MVQASPSTPTTSKPPPKTSRKKPPRGRRQELVWKPSSAETITLNEISRNFQYFVNANSSAASEPTLSRRRGRYTTRTSHRCPGYNRIEITLTSDIEHSAIVSHASPTPHEICPVCKEVVKDSEIFNCMCGGQGEWIHLSLYKCSILWQMMNLCLLSDVQRALIGIIGIAQAILTLILTIMCVEGVR